MSIQTIKSDRFNEDDIDDIIAVNGVDITTIILECLKYIIQTDESTQKIVDKLKIIQGSVKMNLDYLTEDMKGFQN